MSSRIALLLLLILLPPRSFAQKVQTISGEYIHYASKECSFEDAEQTAIERARLKALADTYGTVIQSTTTTILANGSAGSEVDVSTLAASEIKGEWLADTRNPQVEFLGLEQNMLVFRARVWGRTRRIAAAPIDFVAKILCNGTDPRFESDRFRPGDDLYLFFRTPVSGYLAVYLIDESQKVYCLLPYRRNESGVMRVVNDRDYVFFSSQCAEKEIAPTVDEYVITSDKAVSYNHIYIIFSPNEFAKANDVQAAVGSKTLPRETSSAGFRKWLAKNRIDDPKMVVRQTQILIQKQSLP